MSCSGILEIESTYYAIGIHVHNSINDTLWSMRIEQCRFPPSRDPPISITNANHKPGPGRGKPLQENDAPDTAPAYYMIARLLDIYRKRTDQFINLNKKVEDGQVLLTCTAFIWNRQPNAQLKPVQNAPDDVHACATDRDGDYAEPAPTGNGGSGLLLLRRHLSVAQRRMQDPFDAADVSGVQCGMRLET